jgi:hypothetical protein
MDEESWRGKSVRVYNGPKFLAHWFTPREPQDDE